MNDPHLRAHVVVSDFWPERNEFVFLTANGGELKLKCHNPQIRSVIREAYYTRAIRLHQVCFSIPSEKPQVDLSGWQEVLDLSYSKYVVHDAVLVRRSVAFPTPERFGFVFFTSDPSTNERIVIGVRRHSVLTASIGYLLSEGLRFRRDLHEIPSSPSGRPPAQPDGNRAGFSFLEGIPPVAADHRAPAQIDRESIHDTDLIEEAQPHFDKAELEQRELTAEERKIIGNVIRKQKSRDYYNRKKLRLISLENENAELHAENETLRQRVSELEDVLRRLPDQIPIAIPEEEVAVQGQPPDSPIANPEEEVAVQGQPPEIPRANPEEDVVDMIQNLNMNSSPPWIMNVQPGQGIPSGKLIEICEASSEVSRIIGFLTTREESDLYQDLQMDPQEWLTKVLTIFNRFFLMSRAAQDAQITSDDVESILNRLKVDCSRIAKPLICDIRNIFYEMFVDRRYAYLNNLPIHRDPASTSCVFVRSRYDSWDDCLLRAEKELGPSHPLYLAIGSRNKNMFVDTVSCSTPGTAIRLFYVYVPRDKLPCNVEDLPYSKGGSEWVVVPEVDALEHHFPRSQSIHIRRMMETLLRD